VADLYAADQSGATDFRCGLVQPVSVEIARRLSAALIKWYKVARAEEHPVPLPDDADVQLARGLRRIDDFAKQIIEGSGGMNAYEAHEFVSWPYSDRIAASVWTMRCLSNPRCEGSDVAIAAILARREQLK